MHKLQGLNNISQRIFFFLSAMCWYVMSHNNEQINYKYTMLVYISLAAYYQHNHYCSYSLRQLAQIGRAYKQLIYW